MKRIALFALLVHAFAGLVRAGDETVTFKSGDESVSAFLATPAGEKPFPAVVVIHEWWGLNDWVKNQARALAKEGYLALAVDLYRGQVAADKDQAHQLMNGMPRDRALRDLKAAMAYLAGRQDVRKDRIGSIGWCMGGGYSINMAVEAPELAACVVYYGQLPTEPKSVEKIHAPVLGNFGAKDGGPSPDQVKEFEAAMKKAGKSVDVKIYEGAGHAFANETNAFGGYREDAAKDAWKRTVDFLAKTLKAK